MPFTTCQQRASEFQVTGSIDSQTGKKSLVMSASISYLVEATGYSDPSLIDCATIGCLPDLPQVNLTAYYNAATNQGLPQAVCSSKQVTRLSDNGFFFEVECEFQTYGLDGEACSGTTPPDNLTDITPTVQSQISSYERVMYSDLDGDQCWKIPYTDTPFSSPITETIPIITLTVTQYESALSFDQQLARSFKTNSDTYRGKSSGLWLIGAVSAVETEVYLSGGPTTCVRVTYPITLSERFYYPPGVSPIESNRSTFGWKKVQPLVDTMKRTAAPESKLVPMVDDESGNVRSGYISAADGTERVVVPGSNDDRPDYLKFTTQESINFASFLQA